MYQLYIANKNYSSWSLRPWLLMQQLRIPFQENFLRFGDTAAWDRYRKISPNGLVPCLVDEKTVIWDSLSIVEYLAERHEGVWPHDGTARAWARSAAAEMHSGFQELRTRCSNSCGVRITLNELTPGLQRDIDRISTLWKDGLTRFGGPYLAGDKFTAVDAFFSPVAFRIQTYGLELDLVSMTYARRLLDLPHMRNWYEAALGETFRDEPHERDMLRLGKVVRDLRAPAR